MLRFASIPLAYLEANEGTVVRKTVREMFGIPNDRRIIATITKDVPSMSFQVAFVVRYDDFPLVDAIFVGKNSEPFYFNVGE